MPDKSRIKFGEPLPGFVFKPREYLINAHWAEEFRQGRCTQKQFQAMKMLVVEVGIDSKTEIEGYRLLSHLPGVMGHRPKMVVQWRLKIYIESNFELCDPSSDLSF
jgi:hypothetical protein